MIPCSSIADLCCNEFPDPLDNSTYEGPFNVSSEFCDIFPCENETCRVYCRDSYEHFWGPNGRKNIVTLSRVESEYKDDSDPVPSDLTRRRDSRRRDIEGRRRSYVLPPHSRPHLLPLLLVLGLVTMAVVETREDETLV